MRYYLIDRVTELVIGERASGIKCVSLCDEILHDHFPGFPVMPGALIVEGAAQLSGFLLEMTLNAEPSGGPVRRAILGQISRAKFHAPAVPGDTLCYEATIASMLDNAAKMKAEVRVAGELIARSEFTLLLHDVDVELLNEQRRRVYQMWTRGLDPCPTIR